MTPPGSKSRALKEKQGISQKKAAPAPKKKPVKKSK
jgi:hypothetical protein